MARVKTERMVMDGSVRKELEFKFDVDVNQDGEFTTTIPADVALLFEKAGIQLHKNRIGNRGFFSNKIYQGLIEDISEKCKELMSRECISENIVIQYVIQTACSYCINDAGEFVPNGNWVQGFNETNEKTWKNGTVATNATNQKPFGFNIYAKPYIKKVYRFKSGKEITEYDMLTAFGSSQVKDHQPNLKWLEGIVSITKPEGPIQEIEYTEEIGAFFVSMYKAVFRINEQIKNFIDPVSIKKLAANGIKFLGK